MIVISECFIGSSGWFCRWFPFAVTCLEYPSTFINTHTHLCIVICWLQYMPSAVQIRLTLNIKYGFSKVLLTYHGGNYIDLFLKDLIADKSEILFITFLYIEK